MVSFVNSALTVALMASSVGKITFMLGDVALSDADGEAGQCPGHRIPWRQGSLNWRQGDQACDDG